MSVGAAGALTLTFVSVISGARERLKAEVESREPGIQQPGTVKRRHHIATFNGCKSK